MQNRPPIENSEQAQALGLSPERYGKDADADDANWDGVASATAASYTNAGEMYEEEAEVGKTVVSIYQYSYDTYNIVLFCVSYPLCIFAFMKALQALRHLGKMVAGMRFPCVFCLELRRSSNQPINDKRLSYLLRSFQIRQLFCNSSQRCKTWVLLRLDS